MAAGFQSPRDRGCFGLGVASPRLVVECGDGRDFVSPGRARLIGRMLRAGPGLEKLVLS